CSADKVIFPGVGEASTAMAHLRKTGLDQVIPSLKQPTFGICLGQQLMCRYSEENDTNCLGIFEEDVKLFPKTSGESRLKVPQIGWNALHDLKSPLLKTVEEGSFAYFVHSFYVETGAHTIATTKYGLPFSAALHRDNFYATQFHPEKSADTGAKILKNFIEL
ncbi:MAG: imidazole glycerol phosphate synthase subunit HisH, partial [Bacteroidota bacterium]